jgi:hypothetical protein
LISSVPLPLLEMASYGIWSSSAIMDMIFMVQKEP